MLFVEVAAVHVAVVTGAEDELQVSARRYERLREKELPVYSLHGVYAPPKSMRPT